MKASPYFKSQNVAVIVGLASLGFAWFCLRDAYNRRNQKPPFPIRLIGGTGPG